MFLLLHRLAIPGRSGGLRAVGEVKSALRLSIKSLQGRDDYVFGCVQAVHNCGFCVKIVLKSPVDNYA